MKFKIETKPFLNALQAIQPASKAHERYGAVEAGGVLISALSPYVILTCNTGSTQASANLKADIEQDSSIPVHIDPIIKWLKLVEGNTISASLTEMRLMLSCGKTRTSLKRINEFTNDFEVMQPVEYKEVASIPSGLLAKALSRVVFAAAKDDTLPAMAGVYVEFRKDSVMFTATDGIYLAHAMIPCVPTRNVSCIIPSYAIDHLLLMIGKSKEPVVSIHIDEKESALFFYVGDFNLITRVISYPYPNYENIIPKKYITKTEFSANEMLTTISHVLLFSDPGNNMATFEPAEQDTLKISSSSEVGDTLEEDVHAKLSEDTSGLPIKLNCRLLKDLLTVFKGQNVSLMISPGSGPVKVSGEDENYYSLLMPIGKNKTTTRPPAQPSGLS